MTMRIIGGIFREHEAVIKVIEELKLKGYSIDDISVFAKSSKDVRDIEHETNADIITDSSERLEHAERGAGIGALSGGLLGGSLGAILGAGLIAIPGIGPIVAAGPIVAGLTGAGVGLGSGGIIGGLAGAGIPEEKAKEYERYLKEGNIVVLVDAKENHEAEIKRIFETHSMATRAAYRHHREL
ncbi:general stress protein [Domibacillus sp. DTU_2020_1001157_1_SI_ALB_TIR_016]|uniref:general stress protein n=1 Tax=Domibacillus sp. DTU_2020_1001157_1_SI_ALB_TIR_016 TaxID=3077789 RepID=UPI0028E5D6BD|nr:general stress protein [Domibacillus sp. DTU_2020_1001157_1_SI_ALB_TIR_016]WNS80019.1 general stress protein [Domibacillus sp. DTU_2020_1001157_1_SI_ALB_TIR_016]